MDDDVKELAERVINDPCCRDEHKVELARSVLRLLNQRAAVVETVRMIQADLDATARAVAADVVAERDQLRKERDALRYQIAHEGCAAAHYGERTYECDVTRMCGLCRLRGERDELARFKAAVLDALEGAGRAVAEPPVTDLALGWANALRWIEERVASKLEEDRRGR